LRGFFRCGRFKTVAGLDRLQGKDGFQGEIQRMDKYLILICTTIAATPAAILLLITIALGISGTDSELNKKAFEISGLIIQGLATSGTLAAVYVAWKALDSWKKIKKTEFILENLKNIKAILKEISNTCSYFHQLKLIEFNIRVLENKDADGEIFSDKSKKIIEILENNLDKINMKKNELILLTKCINSENPTNKQKEQMNPIFLAETNKLNYIEHIKEKVHELIDELITNLDKLDNDTRTQTKKIDELYKELLN